jgi:mevalonate kinase
MTSIAPGKIILSGEHAVVYGRPALVMAVNRHAMATFAPQYSKLISFDLHDFQLSSSFTLRALRELKDRLLKNYHLFLSGELSIKSVLSKPFDLFHFLIITMIDGLQLTLERGIRIHLESNIPIGCGMGSSAATILSVLRGIAEFFSLDFQPDKFYNFGLQAESLQHGRPSGVDPYISLHGGFVRFQNKNAVRQEMPRIPIYLANTGLPKATTGECVSHVADHFSDSTIWEDFQAVTEEMEKALASENQAEVLRLIRENNELLISIGVVPEKVQMFIEEIEKWGGAAKISGAGSTNGHNGGIVLIYAEQPPVELCQKYNYPLIPVQGEPLGARII